MFSAFSLMGTPFDLQAALDSWATSAPEYSVPQFNGKPKRKEDPAPDAWLDLVEKGCSARRVPKAHWPAVAKHFMGKKARGRVCEVEKVMMALHGEQWSWSWKNFRVAVLNMGWNIDEKKTREINVERKASGLWKIVTGQKDDAATPASAAKNGGGSKQSATASPPAGKRALGDAQTNKLSKQPGSAPKRAVLPSKPSGENKNKDRKSKEKEKEKQKESKAKEAASRPTPPRSSSLFSLPALPFLRAPAPQPEPSVLTKFSAQVPLWLLAATDALATLANENPDVLTAIATGLVAVGTLSSGGGAAVAAVGEAAVVVGRALKTAHDRVHSGHRVRAH